MTIHHLLGWPLQRVERPSIDMPEEPLSMMTQETYVKIEELKKQGWTNKEIGEETGFHPSTIARHLAAEGPPTKRGCPIRCW